MAQFLSWLVNKMRFRRNAMSTSTDILNQFAIYYGSYSNWKHDPKPLIFVMYSDANYTHGININYMSSGDKAWFARAIQLMKKGGQQLTGVTMYRLLKMRRYSIVKECYRLYFTSLLDMKMVSAGLTPLHGLVYKNIVKDPWLQKLNESIEPESIEGPEQPQQVAFSPDELENRITQATNAQPIQQKRVAPHQRKPQWQQGSPWTR